MGVSKLFRESRTLRAEARFRKEKRGPVSRHSQDHSFALRHVFRRAALQVQADYLGNARIFRLRVRFKKRKVGASETRL
jgi:hypothetical protein